MGLEGVIEGVFEGVVLLSPDGIVCRGRGIVHEIHHREVLLVLLKTIQQVKVIRVNLQHVMFLSK